MNTRIIFVFIMIVSCNFKEKSNEQLPNVIPSIIHLGDVNFTDTSGGSFFVRNALNEKIKLLKIENGCGCTSAKVSDSIINPNDSLKVTIKYLPKISNDTGHIVKYMTVRIDKNPYFLNVKIEANVKK